MSEAICTDIDIHLSLEGAAMSRLQLALNVDDLETSVDFYSRLFATEPAKVRPGYANFAVAEPPLKLVLIENPGHGGSINHLGLEGADTAVVNSEQTRLAEAGFASIDERGTTCCYAQQDKFWVEDAPSGERWEIYTVLADSETFFEPADKSGEITDGTDDTGSTDVAGCVCCGS